jgi:hypothetical protein
MNEQRTDLRERRDDLPTRTNRILNYVNELKTNNINEQETDLRDEQETDLRW